MIAPIGSFLSAFDTKILAAMDVGIRGLTAYAALPVATCLSLYYLIRGVQIAQGDGTPVAHFATQLTRNVIILWVVSNADVYNKWVRDFFFTGLPTALNKAVLQQTGVGAANVANGVTGTAAAFDQLWDLMNVQVGNVYQHADFLDVSSKVAAQICSLTGGLALLVIALVYLLSRVILAVVIELGVLGVACLIFDATKPIFERWLGKVIALVFLQVTAIVVLQIVISTDQEFMKTIAASHVGGDIAAEVQGLVAMVCMFGMGAFAIYSLPAIAYSIGTGVSVSVIPPLYLAVRGAQAAAGLLSGFGARAAAEGGEMSMGVLAQREAALASSGGGSIAAPDPAGLPPPPLSLPGD